MGWWEKKLHKLHRNGSHCSSNSHVIGQISSMLNTFSQWLPKAWNQWSSHRKDFLWNIFPGFCLVFSWVFVFVFLESFCLVAFLCYGKDPVIIHYCSLLWTSRPFYVAVCLPCVFFFSPSTRNKALDLVSCNVPPLSLCDALVLLLQIKDSIASSSGLHVMGFLNANATSKSPDLLSV